MATPSIIDFPSAFLDRTRDHFGIERGESVVNSLQSESSISIRKNIRKMPSHLNGEQVPWCPEGLWLNERISFTLDPFFHAGTYYVQEASSMILHEALKSVVDFNKDIIVLDACASPGGKTTQLLDHLSLNSVLVSNEVIKTRIPALHHNVSKWGTHNFIITNADVEVLAKSNVAFDLIVVDAPCSGEGLFRKNKKSVQEWSVENCHLCAARQKKILASAMQLLKPGGILFYSTCTLNKDENEHNMIWLKQYFQVEFPPLPHLTKFNLHHILEKDTSGYYFLPPDQKSEPFFFSVIQKKESAHNSFVKNKNKPQAIDRKLADLVIPEMKNHIITYGSSVFLRNPQTQNLIESNWLKGNIWSVGRKIADLKGKDIIPDIELAFSNYMNNNHFPTVSLNLESSLNYLRKLALHVSIKDTGWNLIQYENTNLGFVKNIGQRINNYYPKSWRIEKL